MNGMVSSLTMMVIPFVALSGMTLQGMVGKTIFEPS
jgi:hypothetical protein